MVERRELALDDAIDKFLPPGIHAPTRKDRPITLLDLATHTSGLPRVPNNMTSLGIDNPYRDYSPARMYTFLSGYALPRDIGVQFEYSNYGMGLLGQLLARKGGTTYEALVRQRITEPLHMSDTTITLTSAQKKRFAKGHRGGVAVSNWDMAALAPAGALRSTADDLLTFLAANMGLKATPLRKAMDLALTPRRPTDMGTMKVGLAWLIHATGTQSICWHNGGTGGYRSFIGFNRAAKTGIVVLTNGAHDVDDIGFHFFFPAVPLTDCSAPAPTLAQPAKPVPVALLPGETLPTGDALFERAIQHLGGREAMAKIHSRRTRADLEMTVFGMTLKGSTVTDHVGPDRTYTKTYMPSVITAEEGFDGNTAWEFDPEDGLRILGNREKAIALLANPFDLASGKDLYRTFTCVGKFQASGHLCYKVIATSRNHSLPVTWYFAADSGLPVGREYVLEENGGKSPVQEWYSDYQTVDKILYPFDTRQLVEGSAIRIRVRHIDHNLQIPANRFAPPPAAKKLQAPASRGAEL